MADELPLLEWERYVDRLFAPEDEALLAAREQMKLGGLPEIAVSPSQGKLLHVLARLAGARRILELGTLGGYSAICLARALPEGGKLVSLELDPRHAEVARRNIDRAGLTAKVEVRVGPAASSLQAMADAREPAFDLAFIDADKEAYPDYLAQVFPLVRPGGVILADNTLPRSVLDPQSPAGIPRYNAAVAAHPGLTSIVVPVLRTRGIDGLLVSIKAG